MNPVYQDLIVRVCLGSSLVMAQAILLNWRLIPMAAIPLFAGIAAYGIVAGPVAALVLLPLVAVVFGSLVRPLPQDRYLLLSLASLAIARAIAGSLGRFGGELGTSATSKWIAAQRPASALVFAVALFLLALAVLFLLQKTEMGLGVDVARTARADMQCASLAPVERLTVILVTVAVVLASLTGFVQAAYTGWVDPNVFSIDYAITLLVATLAIGRMPFLGTLLAIGFFLIPDLFSILSGYDYVWAAHLREILWGGAIIALSGPTGLLKTEEAKA